MSANIVDVDAFTSPVVVPTDGDALTAASVLQGFQPLANRTRHLNNRTLGLASGAANLGISGATIAVGDPFSLAGVPVGTDFAISGGNKVVFANAGVYVVFVNLMLFAGDTTNPSRPGVDFELNGVALTFAEADRFSANASHVVQLGFSFMLIAAAADEIALTARSNFPTGTTVHAGNLSILRIK